MAWTVAFALLGAILFAILLAPVLTSYFFRGHTHEWHNPVLELVTRVYRGTVEWTLRHRALTLQRRRGGGGGNVCPGRERVDRFGVSSSP